MVRELRSLLVFREGVVDFVVVARSTALRKDLDQWDVGDTFVYNGETYTISSIAPLESQRRWYPYNIQVKWD